MNAPTSMKLVPGYMAYPSAGRKGTAPAAPRLEERQPIRTRACHRSSVRLGAATIELAICLPVIVTIIFGSIESCNLIFLRQAATTAAYEGALVAMKTGADEADVILRTNNILAARKITGATLSIDGNGGGFTTLGHGDQFTITLDVPVPANIPAPRLFSSGNMSVSVVAAKQ